MASINIDKITILQELIDKANYIVFFGGAGVSVESGIPDFRSIDGLYNQKYKYNPEIILSSRFFYAKPHEFYEFYKDKMLCLDALPNECHKYLVRLEKSNKLKAIITQNIDGLHQKAGSNCVYELHGSIHRNTCLECGKKFDGEYIKKSGLLPLCDKCGGLIKPDVVLYEEGLDEHTINESLFHINKADLIIIGGTSLKVYPAAGFIRYANKDAKIVLLNKELPELDVNASLLILGEIGKICSKLK